MKENVDLLKEATTHFADHEILLSFENDSGSEQFDYWWYEQGKEMFDKYCEENPLG